MGETIEYDCDDEYISNHDIILKVNLFQNCIHIWTMKPNFEYTCLREKLTEIESYDMELLQDIILQQYSIDNQKVYMDNYNMHQTLGIFQNQYLNRVYLTHCEGVYLQHHKAIMYDKNPLEVPDDTLVIDLGDRNGQLSMVKLYTNDRSLCLDQFARHKQINDLKLVSYHISYHAGVVAFFFIQRNMQKQSGLYAQVNQSGVEFMVVHKIAKLTAMAEKFKQGKCKESVVEQNTPIFIFGNSVKNFVYVNYDRELIIKYQDNCKAASMMACSVVHEMVHDPLNPMDHIAPFLFSSEISRLPIPLFNWFMCFMDLSLVKEFMEENFIEQDVPQVYSMDQFCSLFLIRDPMTMCMDQLGEKSE